MQRIDESSDRPGDGDRGAATAADPRWSAVVARDAGADETFVYSVRTTGVYCRPSCGARRPRPEHVTFHPTPSDAERAGFRPCRRCRPDEPSLAERHRAIVVALCRTIEQASRPPSLAELARQAGMSPHHLHRVFKKIVGVTPRDYAAARRTRRVRDELGRRRSVTAAIHGAGFESSGRFYEAADRMLGMTPGAWRRGGEGTTIRFAVGDCSLGAILVAATARGICAILLGDEPDALLRDLQDRFPKAELIGGDAGFERQVADAVGLVEQPAIGLELPLDLRGTAFQQRVWRALREVPPGSTTTYRELAERIGAPRSARAVAAACAANPLAVAIPCHRVVRSDGSLSGYRWGVERKQALLEREARP